MQSTKSSKSFSGPGVEVVYRALYLVAEEDVYILRVRGKGQAEVRPDELQYPD
jgi:hypothetical protein